MPDIEMAEFGFVAALPKREKSRLSKMVDAWNEVKAITAKHGPLLPREFCAQIADVSKQRIKQLLDDGKIQGVVVGTQIMITESSFEAWMMTPRTAGRPRKGDAPFRKTRLAWKMAYAAAKDMQATALEDRKARQK